MAALSSRDRILQSAKTLFAQGGFENTSTVSIARGAGTSESQLMKHFGSKQGLLEAIFDDGWIHIRQRIQRVRSNGSPAARLYGVLEAIVLELDSDPELKDIMLLEARRVRKDNTDVLLSAGFREFSELLEGIILQMRDEGLVRADISPEALRAAYIGVVEGLLRHQVLARRAHLRADYGLDDVRKVLEIVIPAFGVNPEPRVAGS